MFRVKGFRVLRVSGFRVQGETLVFMSQPGSLLNSCF